MYVIIPVLPIRKAEISEVLHKGWSEVCHIGFIVEVSEGVLVMCLEPPHSDSSAE